jgi:hypothetical protein
MPEIITAAQLRTVLGVSTGLYNDAALNQIIDTAEAVISALVVKDQFAVVEIEREDDVATLYLEKDSDFFIGESITVRNVRIPNFDGTHTITELPNAKTIKFTTNQASNVVRQKLVPKATVERQGRGLGFYADVPEIESAVYEVAVEVLNSRVAPGGSQQGLDFTPSPYRMGQSLARRISGLLSNYKDVNGMVG